MSAEPPQLKVYLKPGCPWCVDAVAFLNEKGYRFEEIDVFADPDKFDEMKRLSGQSCAPTMTCGDLLLADFGIPELKEFLEENDLQP